MTEKSLALVMGTRLALVTRMSVLITEKEKRNDDSVLDVDGKQMRKKGYKDA